MSRWTFAVIIAFVMVPIVFLCVAAQWGWV